MGFSQYRYISTVAFRSTSRSDVTIRSKRWKDASFQLRQKETIIVVIHLSQVSSCRVLINLRNNVLNFAFFTTVFWVQIGFSGVNKHSLLPWQQLSYDLNNAIFERPPWISTCMQIWVGGKNFSFPTLFDSYTELLLSCFYHSVRNV